MSKNQRLGIVFTLSLIVAYLASIAPSYQMPINYGAVVSKSIPLAIVWALIAAFALWHYRKSGLWVLVGAPLALYWPVWLMFNRLPSCYYLHNCV
jgi:hypothetical protein